MSTLQSLSTLQLIEAGADDPLVRLAGPISASHALVVAPNGLDLMCRLLRLGCSAATALRITDRPDTKAFDLVLAPEVTDAAQVGRLVQHAIRALVPTGRFVAYVPHSAGDLEDDVGGLLIRTLRLAGFASVRSRMGADGLLIRADFDGPWVPA